MTSRLSTTTSSTTTSFARLGDGGVRTAMRFQLVLFSIVIAMVQIYIYVFITFWAVCTSIDDY
jgi:hypothetical protein